VSWPKELIVSGSREADGRVGDVSKLREVEDLEAMIPGDILDDVGVVGVYLDVGPEREARGTWQVPKVYRMFGIPEVEEGSAAGESQDRVVPTGDGIRPSPEVICERGKPPKGVPGKEVDFPTRKREGIRHDGPVLAFNSAKASGSIAERRG
jgi:hypothetical protein